MRRIDDKVAYIKEIQRFLISTVPNSEGVVIENGIYDKETKAAVSKFKKENGMSEDSVVDLETFELLYLKYKESKAQKTEELKRGERSFSVGELNFLLNEVGAYYSEYKNVPANDYFSAETQNSVKYLGERFGMDTGGVADGLFIERLRREFELSSEKSEK